jgi:uncharacterized protein (TIGR00255 family)
MISSMTGYGRAQRQMGGRDISVEIKGVNHRYFEFSCRTARSYAFLEDSLKRRVQNQVGRGKVEVGLSIQNLTAEGLTVRLNEGAATAYTEALRRLRDIANIEGDVTLDQLTRFPEIFAVEKAGEDEEALWADVSVVLDEALDGFLAMRRREGESLRADLLSRLEAVERNIAVIENAAPQLTEEHRARLYQKLSELLADRGVDEGRLLTEAALFAERTDVGEETVRLRSHLDQYRAILAEGGPVGRKLDFLTQELNREVNTIGSKIQDVAISRVVVAMKSDIEKIREQIQNIE